MTLREYIKAGNTLVNSTITNYTAMTIDEFDKLMVIKFASWELLKDYTDPAYMLMATDILFKQNKYKYDTLFNSAELTIASGLSRVHDVEHSGIDKDSHSGSDTMTKTGSDITAHSGTDTSTNSGTDSTKHTGNDTHNKTGSDTTTNNLTNTSTDSGGDTNTTTTQHGLTTTTTPDLTTTTTPGTVTNAHATSAYDSNGLIPEYQDTKTEQPGTVAQTGTTATANTGTDTVTAKSELGAVNTTTNAGTVTQGYDSTDTDTYNSTMAVEHGLTNTQAYDSQNKTDYDTTNTQTYNSQNQTEYGHSIHEVETETLNTPAYVDELRRSALFSLAEIIAVDIITMISQGVYYAED